MCVCVYTWGKKVVLPCCKPRGSSTLHPARHADCAARLLSISPPQRAHGRSAKRRRWCRPPPPAQIFGLAARRFPLSHQRVNILFFKKTYNSFQDYYCYSSFFPPPGIRLCRGEGPGGAKATSSTSTFARVAGRRFLCAWIRGGEERKAPGRRERYKGRQRAAAALSPAALATQPLGDSGQEAWPGLLLPVERVGPWCALIESCEPSTGFPRRRRPQPIRAKGTERLVAWTGRGRQGPLDVVYAASESGASGGRQRAWSGVSSSSSNSSSGVRARSEQRRRPRRRP